MSLKKQETSVDILAKNNPRRHSKPINDVHWGAIIVLNTSDIPNPMGFLDSMSCF